MTITDGKGDLIYSSRDLKRKFPEQGFYNHIKIDTDGVILGNSCRPYLGINGYVINNSSIPDSKIIDVDFAKIKNVEINTAHIKDAAITTAKIADAAIITAKIADLAVTEAKIADLAVTNAKIANLSATKINAGYIVTTQLDTATSNPSTGCILDGDGLRVYQSGTKKIDLNPSSAYFEGCGVFGSASGNHIAIFRDWSAYWQIEFKQGGNRKALLQYHAGNVRFTITNDDRGTKLDIDDDATWWGIDALCPGMHASYDLGKSGQAWNNVYYCAANDVCSLGIVEEVANPLELIKNIKISKDKYTPKEIPKADYKTLPNFIKTVKYSDFKKSEKNFKEHLRSILSKNAEVTYEDDEKVTVRIEALDITATISLLLGAIRQLNKKIEALERGNMQ